MKNNILCFFLLFFFPNFFLAQELEFNLTKAGSIYWHGSVYCYGFSENGGFKIYKLNAGLKLNDSLNIELGKINPDDFLKTSADTLHDFLNIYIQEKGKKKVTTLRFSKNFELIATVKNIDIARLNNIALFNNEALYYQKNVYSVKTQRDTSGLKFFLDKYELKSEKENFDYQVKWQFSFDKKTIRSAHVFYANQSQVFVFVNIAEGEKAGQWILVLNASTGLVVRGTKLNDKEETSLYMFGNFLAEEKLKSLTLMGQKFTETQYNQKENKLNINNAASAQIYFITIDSMGMATNKQIFKIPIVAVASGAKNAGSIYILKIDGIKKNMDGKLHFESDIYKSSNNYPCWTYENTTLFELFPSEEKLALKKNTITSNPMLTGFYFSNDKLDMNGKICLDSMNNFENLFLKTPTLPVKQQFKTDSADNAAWILTKHNLRKNSISYSFLKPEKKIYRLSPIQEISKNQEPTFISASNSAFIIATQPEEKKYKLKLFNW